jgi:hypothetical protein
LETVGDGVDGRKRLGTVGDGDGREGDAARIGTFTVKCLKSLNFLENLKILHTPIATIFHCHLQLFFRFRRVIVNVSCS